MFRFIADKPSVNTFVANDVFIATALQGLLGDFPVEDVLNAPRYVVYKRGCYIFKLVGFIAESGNVTLCWEARTSEFGDKVAEVQSVHAGRIAVKF